MAQPIANLLINGLNPVTISTTSTSVQYFPFVPGPSIGVAATSPVAGFVPAPGSGRSNGQRLSVRAVGNIVEGADTVSPVVTIGLYYIKAPTTIVSATTANISSLFTVATSTAGFGSTTGSLWSFTADLIGETTSGLLTGNYSFQMQGAALNTGVTTIVTGINMSNDQPYSLCCGITFSQDGTHVNKASLFQFDLSA